MLQAAANPGARRRAPLRWVAVAAVVALLPLSACGGSSKPASCKDAQDLKSNVQSLVSTNPLSSAGINSIKTDLGEIQTNLTDLKSSASKDFGSECDTFTQSFDALKTAVASVGSEGLSAASAVVTALSGVKTSWDQLTKAIDDKCG